MLSKKQIKYLCQLKQKKYRHIHREFLVEGLRVCEELLSSSYEVKNIFVSAHLGSTIRERELLANAERQGIAIHEVSSELLHRLSSTKSPTPIIAHALAKEHVLSTDFLKGRRFLVLDSVCDPGNVGTLLRTAEAFNWNGAILTGQVLELYNPKVLRSSMGSAFRLPIANSTWSQILSLFMDTDVSYVVTSPKGGDVGLLTDYPAKLALLLGNEAHGISAKVLEHAHRTISIPMSDCVDSLNVAIAGGILLYLLR